MADHFADRYWSTKFWTVNYFQGGEQNPGAMSASLSGAGAIDATISVASQQEDAPHGGDDNLWKRRKAWKQKKLKIAKRLEKSYTDDDDAIAAIIEKFLQEAA